MVRKCIVMLLLVVTIIGFTPLPAAAQTTPSAKLEPCKLTVGLGDTGTEVDALCTVVQVLEDRSNPNGRKLNLHIAVLPATGSEKAEPIFYFEGGPGGSAITNFGQSFFTAFRSLREKHDIVLIDQRGTGKSSSLQCTEITDRSLKDLAENQTDEDAITVFTEGFETCLTRLSNSTDPAFYTSTILADDTDEVRQALGYDKINVYGSSYGTWLAQIYLGRHGENVRAMILDSVAGPWNFYLLEAAQNAQKSLERVFVLCESDEACNKLYPNLKEQMDKALERLDKEPKKTSGLSGMSGKSYPVVMTRSRFLEALRSMLYTGSNIGVIPQVVTSAAKGNFTLAAAQLVTYSELSSQISLGLYYSVHCSETLPFFTDDLLARYKSDDTYFGNSDLEIDSLRSICKAWRAAELGETDVAPVQSDKPVLIYSGVFDPVTSVAFGEETHERLTNSQLVIFPYQGHVPMVTNKCAQNLAEAFIDAPQEQLDTSCTKNDVKPVFLGTYKLELESFTEPGRFSARIPKGWTRSKADDVMTYFESPDGAQYLGLGIFETGNVNEVQSQVLGSVSEAYGEADIQLAVTQSLFFIKTTVVQHGLNSPDEARFGILMIIAQGGESRVVWYAAHPNILQAAVLDVITPLAVSLRVE